MDKNNQVAQRIMELRETKGIYQKDFAALIDMKPSTYCDKENGKTEITINELYRIAKGLDVSISYLLGMDEYNIQNNNNGNTIVVTQNNSGTLYFQISPEMIDNLKNKPSK